ncbi:MAG: DUF1343 domain-containing protein [Bacteroidetes bacterium]|nr:DUF1343 domain-containing protein [Bacteroidota bacterium]
MTLIFAGSCSVVWAQSTFETTLKTGSENTALYLPQLKGKKIGIIANATSVIRKKTAGQHTHLVDSLIKSGITVVKIFSPEHGFRIAADAGEKVASQIDTKTGLPIISLYGSHRKPTVDDLKEVDLLVFDIQDVGVRFYTYIATLQYVIEAAAEMDIPILVLDRPNPNGAIIDGPVMEEENKSFLGLQSIPLVYGMTIGEYALMLQGENWLKTTKKPQLTVIPMRNYARDFRYDLPIKPSPNLPNRQAIGLYPSLGLFEGTVINAGRGTTLPFQQFGSKDLDPAVFPHRYTPESVEGAKNPKQLGTICYGEDLSGVTLPDHVCLKWIIKAYTHHSSEFFLSDSFRLHSGQSQLEQLIRSGKSESEIRQTWSAGIEQFKAIRKDYLLYPEADLSLQP